MMFSLHIYSLILLHYNPHYHLVRTTIQIQGTRLSSLPQTPSASYTYSSKLNLRRRGDEQERSTYRPSGSISYARTPATAGAGAQTLRCQDAPLASSCHRLCVEYPFCWGSVTGHTVGGTLFSAFHLLRRSFATLWH